jgi:phosphoribosylformylglycinamidine synthase
MKARVTVTLRPGILDSQGKAVAEALSHMGEGINEVRVGKFIEVDVAENDPTAARAAVEKMCQSLLANPVTEDYRIELVTG